MGVLNFIAWLAAVVLSLELMVATLLFAAIAGGVWFGLRIGERKLNPLFQKVNGYVDTARSLERTALGFGVKPFIAAHALGVQIGTTVSTIVEDARKGRSGADPL